MTTRPRTVLLLAASLLTIGLVAVGCSPGDTTVVASGEQQAGITMGGLGEARAAPDTGYLQVGVEVTRDTVAEARDAAAEAAGEVIASLKDNDVDEADIRTSDLSIYPRYDYRNGDEPQITGYVVTNRVSVVVRDLDAFSAIFDDAVAAGGDDTRVSGVRFDIEDRETVLMEARALAMADARQKAEQLADLGNVDLGDPLSISESSSGGSVPAFRDDAAEDGGATPIEPGQTTVTVTVSVRYAIE